MAKFSRCKLCSSRFCLSSIDTTFPSMLMNRVFLLSEMFPIEFFFTMDELMSEYVNLAQTGIKRRVFRASE